MTYLVTGGFGFIGSAVVRRLLAMTDAVVVNLDIEPVEKPEGVAWIDPTHR